MSRNASRSSGRLVGLRALGVSQGRLDLDAKPQKWTKQTVKLAHLTLVKWKPKPGGEAVIANSSTNQRWFRNAALAAMSVSRPRRAARMSRSPPDTPGTPFNSSTSNGNVGTSNAAASQSQTSLYPAAITRSSREAAKESNTLSVPDDAAFTESRSSVPVRESNAMRTENVTISIPTQPMHNGAQPSEPNDTLDEVKSSEEVPSNQQNQSSALPTSDLADNTVVTNSESTKASTDLAAEKETAVSQDVPSTVAEEARAESSTTDAKAADTEADEVTDADTSHEAPQSVVKPGGADMMDVDAQQGTASPAS